MVASCLYLSLQSSSQLESESNVLAKQDCTAREDQCSMWRFLIYVFTQKKKRRSLFDGAIIIPMIVVSVMTDVISVLSLS